MVKNLFLKSKLKNGYCYFERFINTSNLIKLIKNINNENVYIIKDFFTIRLSTIPL